MHSLCDHRVVTDLYVYYLVGESCENCISARVCVSSVGTYLNITRLFNHSLSISPCELHFTTDTVINNTILSEEMCIELSSNMNYSIMCPICCEVIHYKIPDSIFFNTENCLDSGTYSYSY